MCSAIGMSMLNAKDTLYDGQLWVFTGFMRRSSLMRDIQVTESDDNVDHAVPSAAK